MRNTGTGERNVALRAPDGSAQTLVADVTVRVQSTGEWNYAILVTGSGTDIVLERITALSENGSEANFGLYNSAGAASMLSGGTYAAREGNHASGILNTDSGTTLQAQDVTASGESAVSLNVGLENTVNATADVTQSILRGTSASVGRFSGAVTISHSRLVSAAVSGKYHLCGRLAEQHLRRQLLPVERCDDEGHSHS